MSLSQDKWGPFADCEPLIFCVKQQRAVRDACYGCEIGEGRMDCREVRAQHALTVKIEPLSRRRRFVAKFRHRGDA